MEELFGIYLSFVVPDPSDITKRLLGFHVSSSTFGFNRAATDADMEMLHDEKKASR